MSRTEQHISREKLRSALTVSLIRSVYGSRFSSRTARFCVAHGVLLAIVEGARRG